MFVMGRVAGGRWRIGNGEWGMGNGEWGMGNGEWRMGNGEQYYRHTTRPSPLTPHHSPFTTQP